MITTIQSARQVMTTLAGRSALAPAAVRLERSHLKHAAGQANQTALTVWFGVGPALPSPGTGGRVARTALKTAASVLAAAALGVLTVVAARRDEARLDAAQPVPRLEG